MSFFTPEDFWPGKDGEGPVSKMMLAGFREKAAADANAKRDAEIERLRAEVSELHEMNQNLGKMHSDCFRDNARLREALQRVVEVSSDTDEPNGESIARAALEGE